MYELRPNERPSQAMKRKSEEMESELSSLRQIYDYLRLSPVEEAMEVFRRIRASPADGSSLQSIRELAGLISRDGNSIPPTSATSEPIHDFAYENSLTLPPLRIVLGSTSIRSAHSYLLPEMSGTDVRMPVNQQRHRDAASDWTR